MSSSRTITVQTIYALQNYSNVQDYMLFKTMGSDAPLDGQAKEYIYREGDNKEADGINVIRHKNNGGNFLLISGNSDLLTVKNYSDVIKQQKMKLIFVEEDETNENDPTLYLSVNKKLYWLVMQEVS